MNQIPSLGRIVHVVWPDGVESPALITRTAADTQEGHHLAGLPMDRWGHKPSEILSDDQVDLQVLGLTEVYPLYGVSRSEGAAWGHWHWPEVK